mgnify:FL=1
MTCIEMFKKAAVAMQTDERYIELDAARRANDADEELQNLIGDFNLARMDLNNELSMDERNDERISELNEKINQTYTQVMNHPGMKRYNEAKAAAEQLVNHSDAIINTALNGGDPMPVEAPAAGGCSGSCSSCSGCH